MCENHEALALSRLVVLDLVEPQLEVEGFRGRVLGEDHGMVELVVLLIELAEVGVHVDLFLGRPGLSAALSGGGVGLAELLVAAALSREGGRATLAASALAVAVVLRVLLLLLARFLVLLLQAMRKRLLT